VWRVCRPWTHAKGLGNQRLRRDASARRTIIGVHEEMKMTLLPFSRANPCASHRESFMGMEFRVTFIANIQFSRALMI